MHTRDSHDTRETPLCGFRGVTRKLGRTADLSKGKVPTANLFARSLSLPISLGGKHEGYGLSPRRIPEEAYLLWVWPSIASFTRRILHHKFVD